MDKLRDITPEEKELIKELKKMKKKKKKLSNDCKKCYYAVLCYERGRGVACTNYKPSK